MTELEQKILMDLVDRVTRLEAAVVPIIGAMEEAADTDLDGLDPDERQQVMAARQRLENDTGQGIDTGMERGNAPVAYDTDEGTIVRFPPVDEEYRERRRTFAASVLKLETEELVDAYASGGPLWLYAYDRDMVYGMPLDIKRVMVEDALRDSPQEAFDMGRDLFKATQADGPARSMEALIGES